MIETLAQLAKMVEAIVSYFGAEQRST